jgi:2-amino-4-hydroxy-6-hydroxymethyldihydropteridine diphosphokinase
MVECLIALGANLGDRAATLEAALALIAEDSQSRLIARSGFYETAAVGGPAGQQAFLNAAARIETSRDCAATWELLSSVERRLGRVRDVRWGPRTIDLDLLLYGSLVLKSADLEVPHPRMAFRRFVLAPAAEVAAEMVHPTIGWTMRQLLAHLDTRPNYAAIAGPIGAGKSRLASHLAANMGWRPLGEPIVDARLKAYYGDPRSTAWATEQGILQERTKLLAANAWPAPEQWTASDFWFDQSLAFARTTMADAEFAAFQAKYDAAASEVVRPKFVVWLDAPTEVLLRRIAERGRVYEQHLNAGALDRLRAELERQLAEAAVGPVLRIEASEIDAIAAEVDAAARAMG